jgi:hypothetical protein
MVRWFGNPETIVTVGIHLRTIISSLLVRGVKSEDSGLGTGANASRIDTKHGVFLSAEATKTGMVDRNRHRFHCIADVDATSHSARAGREQISALSAACRVTVVGQNRIDQATGGRTRNASPTDRTTLVCQSRREPDRGIGRFA